MRPREVALVVLGAVLGAAVAWLASRTGPAEGPDLEAAGRAAALERQVAELERRLAERGPPSLASAPTRAGPPPPAGTAHAADGTVASSRRTPHERGTSSPPPDDAAVPAATAPELVQPLLGGAGAGGGGGTWVRSGAPTEPPPPPLDPSEVRRLLDSGDRADLARALDDIARTRDRSHLPTLVDLVHRPERREDVSRLVDVIATTKDRRWSALQATGAPDTPVDGDLGTAWASKRPEMGRVTLDLGYERPVRVDAVRVHETHAPGAVVEVLVRGAGGAWTSIWEGTAPTQASPAWFEPAVRPTPFATDAVRLVLDTDRVPGWNEIDAVELLGDGLRQWATTATASSSFSD